MKYAILSFKRSLKKRRIHVAIAVTIRQKSGGTYVSAQQIRFNKDGQRRRYFYYPEHYWDMQSARAALRFEAEAKNADIRFYPEDECST